jgi:hypothetical protein
MCTKEDLSELERATFLLKKGYEIQKISVSTIGRLAPTQLLMGCIGNKQLESVFTRNRC